MHFKKGTVSAIMVVLSLSLIIGCSQQAKDVTYTTISSDARNYFDAGLAANDDIQIDEAREQFARAREADPDFAMAYYYGALTSTTTAEFDDLLAKAVELAPRASQPEQLIIASLKAGNEGNTEQTEANLKQLVELLPEGKRAHYMLGNFYFGQQKWPLAETQYQMVIKLDPNFAAAYNNLAYVYSNQEKFPESIEALKKYSELKPEDPNVHDSMGEIYLRMQDYEKSVQEYDNALKLMPDFVFSLVGLGDNAVFIGEYDRGRAEYNKIFTHAHSVADTNAAYFWIALSYIYEGKLDDAISTLQEQLKFAEAHNEVLNQGTIHAQMAAINREKGDFLAALREAASARQFAATPEIQPGPRGNLLRNICYTEAIVFTHQDKPQLAENAINEFYQSAEDSKNPVALKTYHGLRGVVLYWKQDYVKAIEELGQADPLDQYAKFYLGLCYHETGLEDLAGKVFEEIATYNDSNFAYSFVRSEAMNRAESAAS